MTLCCRLPRQSGNAHLQLADVLRAAVPGLAARQRLPAHHWKTLHALLRCHTPALGGHLYGCAACGKEHFVPHSCRNRHCPGCQRAQADDWLERQQASLLPVSYFHVVFTLPHVLNHMISQNQRELYKLLFDSASATLLTFGEARLQAQIGVTAVLHTWSQTLLDHYHLHCVVTGGGLSLHDQQWRSTSSRYLFPVRALSKVFRGKFLNGLQKLYEDGKLRFYGALAPLAEPPSFTQLLRAACATEWVVYSKQPFAGPRAVLAYLSRYTHRVAIGPGRLRALDPRASTVTFTYKDYADAGRRKKMQLKLTEFLRRFCLHILPPRFVKIRHYGLLGNRHRTSKVAAARLQLTAENRGTAASIASRPSSAPVAPVRVPALRLGPDVPDRAASASRGFALTARLIMRPRWQSNLHRRRIEAPPAPIALALHRPPVICCPHGSAHGVTPPSIGPLCPPATARRPAEASSRAKWLGHGRRPHAYFTL